MTPAPELLSERVKHTESLVASGEVHYPHLKQLDILADGVKSIMEESPETRRGPLLSKLLENTQLQSLASHIDEDMPQMGLMTFISGDLLTLVRHSLLSVSQVLTEEEKSQITPIQKKFENPNDPKTIHVITSAAKLLVPHLIKTSSGKAVASADVASGAEQSYDFDFRALRDNPAIIEDLIKLAK